jgi:hypothetical protein
VPDVPMLAHMTRMPWKNSLTMARMSADNDRQGVSHTDHDDADDDERDAPESSTAA